MILNKIHPIVDPILDDCQAGFRWGSDLQAYSLLETLSMRRHTCTYSAFMDIRKAFDVAWQDGAMLRLHRAGIQNGLWHLIDDMVSDRTATVQVSSLASCAWDVENGIGQGSVLSGFLSNVLINGLATDIKRACNGVTCPGNAERMRVHVLLYTDDLVILSDNPANLQCALDSAHAWARSWRFHFAVGPQETTVMCFGPGRMRGARPQFRLGNQLVPIVNTYTYLGIVFHENLQWRHHVDHVLARGEARIAACIFWTASEDLPVHLTERVFQTYVCPSVYFGFEFISQPSQLQRMNRRMFQWGRRLLMWPQGAPTAAVQGQLGWARCKCTTPSCCRPMGALVEFSKPFPCSTNCASCQPCTVLFHCFCRK